MTTMRLPLLGLGVTLLAGCLIGGGKNNDGQPWDTGSVSDVREDVGEPTSDMGRDEGNPDVGQPPDEGTPDDTGSSDMGVDMQPDMPDVRELSTVCGEMPPSTVTGTSLYRMRVGSTGTELFGGYIVPDDNAWLLSHTLSQWETGTPGWVRTLPIAGDLNNPLELEESNVTGIALLPVMGTGQTDVFVTRVPEAGNECLYGEAGSQNLRLDCAGAWGAEATNTAVQPRYFWFGAGGTIGSTPADDFDPMSQQIVVPWCATDPADEAACLAVSFRATDARGNRGPNVLLSDAEGRAYLWDTVQNIDGTTEAIDCTTPPTAPVPLVWQGGPVMFANADVVRLDDGSQFLVRQTENSVALHPLSASLQPMAPMQELTSNGRRPHFDAFSDGTRIGAVAAVNSDIRIFAFGPTGSVMDVQLDDEATSNILGIGGAVHGDQIAVMAGHNGTRFVSSNAYVMWTN